MGLHPSLEDHRVVVGFKNNYGPNAQAVEYRIQMNAVAGYETPPIWLSRMGEPRITARQLLARRTEEE